MSSLSARLTFLLQADLHRQAGAPEYFIVGHQASILGPIKLHNGYCPLNKAVFPPLWLTGEEQKA